MMKNHIHTIPVLDAIRAAGERCPFCQMRASLERDAVAFIMGPAYMEDGVRMETNRAGFCAAHLRQMYANQNRLGMALMLHTHLKTLNGALAGKDVKKLSAALDKAVNGCYVCGKVEETFALYVQTYFRLWQNGGEEAKLIEAAGAFCVPHFALALRGRACLGKKDAARFMDIILPAQREHMKRMEEDLEWFTLKFDYRNVNEPWKNAKDALPRAVNMLVGGNQCEG